MIKQVDDCKGQGLSCPLEAGVTVTVNRTGLVIPDMPRVLEFMD